MQIRIYTFSKRKNSTARPSAGGVEINVNLKRSTSVSEPVFLLQGDVEEYLLYNYAQFNDRFYFIKDVSIDNNNIVSISCTIDVLATYKTEIAGYTCYIERSASSYDVMVSDSAISQSNVYETHSSTISTQLPYWSFQGTFLVRVVGQAESNSSLGVTTYAVSAGQIKSLFDFLFTDSNFDFLSDSSVKSFFNPFQYIVSVTWFPIVADAFGTTMKNVKMGWWDSGVSAVLVTNPVITFTVNINVPASSYNDFRSVDAKWSTLQLRIPGCGTYPINPLQAGSVLELRYGVDIATGECYVNVFSDIGFCGCFSGKYASSIAIGQLDTNMRETLGNTASFVGSILSGDIGGALSSLVDAHTNVLQPTPSYNGTAGNMGAILAMQRANVYRYEYASKDIPTGVLGRPCCKNLRLGTLSGFIKCAGASISIEGYDNERTQVNNYLNGGFYYE